MSTNGITLKVSGPDTSCNVIVSGYVIFCQINKRFVNTLFFHYCLNVFAAGWNGFEGRRLETPD